MITSKIESKSKRTEAKMHQNTTSYVNNTNNFNNRSNHFQGNTHVPLASQPVVLNTNPNTSFSQQPASITSNEKSSKFTLRGNKKQKKISKTDISTPTGFRLVQHIGLTSNATNFDVTLDIKTI